VIRRKELVRVDGRRDAAADRTRIGSPQSGGVGLVDEHRLDEHRQILVAGRIRVRLPHDAGDSGRDAADEERRYIRLLPAGEVVAQNDRDLRLELHPAAQVVFSPGPGTSSTS
jgi:hypothetical protein